MVEKTMGKREIASYKQFLLFPQCFQKTSFPGVSKGVIVWEWVNGLNNRFLRHSSDKSAMSSTNGFSLN